MTLLDRLQGCEINTHGGVSEESQISVAKAISKHIDDSGAVTYSEVIETLCIVIGIEPNMINKHYIFRRYLGKTNPYIRAKCNIKSITIYNAVLDLVKKTKPRCEFRLYVTTRDPLVFKLSNRSLFYKNKERLEQYLSRRLKEIPPTLNYEFSINPIRDQS